MSFPHAHRSPKIWLRNGGFSAAQDGFYRCIDDGSGSALLPNPPLEDLVLVRGGRNRPRSHRLQKSRSLPQKGWDREEGGIESKCLGLVRSSILDAGREREECRSRWMPRASSSSQALRPRGLDVAEARGSVAQPVCCRDAMPPVPNPKHAAGGIFQRRKPWPKHVLVESSNTELLLVPAAWRTASMLSAAPPVAVLEWPMVSPADVDTMAAASALSAAPPSAISISRRPATVQCVTGGRRPRLAERP